MTPKKKTKKVKVDAWAVVFPNDDNRLFTTTEGLGVFDHKPWAKLLVKKIGEKYVTIVPCTISYEI